ncbi:haloacid dehalogenase type II [Nesterenkonia sp. Hz 6-5]|nr:haloacid dehalogenase type II [Nesterenkonia haasae]
MVFDVNETLSDMGPLGRAFERQGVAAVEADLWFKELLRDGFALTAAGENPDFTELAADSLDRRCENFLGSEGAQKAREEILQVFRSLTLHPDAAEGIPSLRRLTRLATLSNGPAAVAESLLGRAGLAECFDHILSVQDAPRWKPAQEAYDYAARMVEQNTSEMMLVASHPWDIHGAHAAGMRTAWINRDDGRYPRYFASPDIIAQDFEDLAHQLGEDI